VIEASSYQLEYSKFFKSEYSLILNLYPDHLERHGNFKNYTKAKFKLIKQQLKNNYAFIEKKNYILNNLIKNNKINSKIYRVNYEKYLKYYKIITNDYFKNISNFKNLSFIFAISKNLKLDLKKIINVTNKFKQLDFRQQIIYNSKKLIIINDSKSTSLSSTQPLLESFKNIYWVLGGISKKGDRLRLKKKNYRTIRAFIYGKDKLFFSKILSNKIKYKVSKSLNHSLFQVFKDLKKKEEKKKVILFSPSAASFDQFKNFEHRGKYFNKIIKKYLKK
jgi:UDP-N-acetylmuramoylalanine-D-glutamate ligase